MPRKPRIDYPGAWHHVMHRGARKAPIFKRDEHVLMFMSTLAEVVDEHKLEVHAYALMPNHYHLLVRSRLGNLSDCMKRVNSAHTLGLNQMHGWDGPVFRGRFRNQLILDDSYLTYLVAYIHLNPIRAGLARRLDQHCWTSHRAYMQYESRPNWLTCKEVLGYFGNPGAFNSFVAGLRKGTDSWPEEFRLVDGCILDQEPASPPRQRRVVEKAMTKAQLLHKISQITGVKKSRIMESLYGPAANPARRFAVWALRHSGRYRHTDIASALDMTETQVAKVLSRLKIDRPEPIASWIIEWRDQEDVATRRV